MQKTSKKFFHALSLGFFEKPPVQTNIFTITSEYKPHWCIGRTTIKVRLIFGAKHVTFTQDKMVCGCLEKILIEWFGKPCAKSSSAHWFHCSKAVVSQSRHLGWIRVSITHTKNHQVVLIIIVSRMKKTIFEC